jgi:hypothetical protein
VPEGRRPLARGVHGQSAPRPFAGVGGRLAGRGGGRVIRDTRVECEALLREAQRLERAAAALARAVAAEAEAEQRRHTRLVLAAWARRRAWRWT